jgi:hypothetical protein
MVSSHRSIQILARNFLKNLCCHTFPKMLRAMIMSSSVLLAAGYTEIIPLRSVFRNCSSKKHISPKWPVFPASSADQVVATSNGALILAEVHNFVYVLYT